MFARSESVVLRSAPDCNSKALRTLNRRFLSATGMVPTDYLHRLRIESAKHLLETSNLTVDPSARSAQIEDV